MNAYEEVIKSNHWLNPYAFKRNINYIFYLEQNLIPIKSTIWLLKILLISLMLQKTNENTSFRKNNELKEQQSSLLKISKFL